MADTITAPKERGALQKAILGTYDYKFLCMVSEWASKQIKLSSGKARCMHIYGLMILTN
jgi:hypothetical protein